MKRRWSVASGPPRRRIFPPPNCPHCAAPMRRAGIKDRRATTLGGPLAYQRSVYECSRCRRSRAPLDEELGLGAHAQLSRGLVRKVAWSAAQHSFEDAAANVLEMTGLEVSAAECQRVGLEVGHAFEQRQRAADAQRLAPVDPEHPAPAPEFASESLVIQADAGSVLTRAGEEHKMVWCGRAFSLEDR